SAPCPSPGGCTREWWARRKGAFAHPTETITMTLASTLPRSADQTRPNWLAKLFDYKPFLIVVCLTPAIGLLLVFLTYPLGLGVWLAFTDTTIGRRGIFVGLENFQYLLSDPLWWSAVFYSVFYTAVATFGKFALGFWLALLL